MRIWVAGVCETCAFRSPPHWSTTAREFIGNGRGRALDNAFIERLWRTVMHDNIYLKDYASVDEVYEGLKEYFWFNRERFHQALNNQTPYQVYHWGPPKRSRRGDRKSRRGRVVGAA